MLCEQIKHLGPKQWYGPCVTEVSKAVAQVQSDCYHEIGKRLSLLCHTYTLIE